VGRPCVPHAAAFDPHAYDPLAPFLDWAVASGVAKVVLLSAMAIDREPDLALVRLERHLNGLGIPATVLRPNLHMQNLSSGLVLDSIRDRSRIELNAGSGRVSETAADFDDVAARVSAASGRPVTNEAVKKDRMGELLRAAQWSGAAAKVATTLFEANVRGERAPVHADLGEIPAAPPVRSATSSPSLEPPGFPHGQRRRAFVSAEAVASSVAAGGTGSPARMRMRIRSGATLSMHLPGTGGRRVVCRRGPSPSAQ